METSAIEAQESELLLLQSMYEVGSEIILGAADESASTHFTMKLDVNDSLVEIFIQLPSLYPLHEYPTVRVSADPTVFNVQELNERVRAWMTSRTLGEPMIGEMIEAVKEEIRSCQTSMEKLSDLKALPQVKKAETYSRFWILSHHLYSKEKRQFIVREAKERGLGGFSTPGKPAVIVVEGESSEVLQFWSNLRKKSWKKITLMESEESQSSSQKFLRFDGNFEEFCFDSGDNKKVDTSKVKQLLEKVLLAEHFNNLYDIK